MVNAPWHKIENLRQMLLRRPFKLSPCTTKKQWKTQKRMHQRRWTSSRCRQSQAARTLLTIMLTEEANCRRCRTMHTACSSSGLPSRVALNASLQPFSDLRSITLWRQCMCRKSICIWQTFRPLTDSNAQLGSKMLSRTLC